MLLKRKRSDSELSFSSNTTFSSPPRPNYYNFSAMAMMDIDSPVSPRTSLSSRPCTPSHLPSRTMKRFRDSRPSDEEVHRKFYEWRAHHQSQNQHQHQSHCLPSLSLSSSSSAVSPSFSSSVASTEHTLKILYEAQHHHQQQHCPPQQLPLEQQQQLPSVYSPPVAAVPQPQAPAQGQRSLHSFWNLPASTPSSASTTPAPSMPLTPAFESNQPSHCEDCGVGLGGEDVTMENEYGLVGASSHCGACGKAVCFSCSVSNLGEQRRCLMCAGRKKWVGGIGWAVSGAGVC